MDRSADMLDAAVRAARRGAECAHCGAVKLPDAEHCWHCRNPHVRCAGCGETAQPDRTLHACRVWIRSAPAVISGLYCDHCIAAIEAGEAEHVARVERVRP